jgi:hypothetical protein
MYPSIFVSDSFFTLIDDFIQRSKNIDRLNMCDESIIAERNYVRIRSLFRCSNIFTDLTDIERNLLSKSKTSSYSSFKNLILHQFAKGYSSCDKQVHFNQNWKILNKSSVCYFVDESRQQCILESSKKGLIIRGKDFFSSEFFLNCYFSNIFTDASLSKVEIAKHPCRSLLIIDKYLFEDTKNYSNKIGSLIDFLNSFISAELEMPFEIDILTQNIENNKMVKSKMEQIIGNVVFPLSLHIYAPKYLKEADRIFLTNYSIFSFGHPFDRNTHVSCSFFPSCESSALIIESFSSRVKKLDFAKNTIDSTPEKYGMYEAKWKNDELMHRIFEEI